MKTTTISSTDLKNWYSITSGNKLKIKQVIYNNPATIVYFSDGSKSVVKTHPEDEFNEQIGFLMCIAKRFLGIEEFHRALKNNVKNYD